MRCLTPTMIIALTAGSSTTLTMITATPSSPNSVLSSPGPRQEVPQEGTASRTWSMPSSSLSTLTAMAALASPSLGTTSLSTTALI